MDRVASVAQSHATAPRIIHKRRLPPAASALLLQADRWVRVLDAVRLGALKVAQGNDGRYMLEPGDPRCNFAIDESVLAPVLSAALFERFSSRRNADFADRVLSAMRKQFGGHDE